jgi:hypothetical protein
LGRLFQTTLKKITNEVLLSESAVFQQPASTTGS